MQAKIKAKIKSFITSSMLAAVLLAVIGTVLFLFPNPALQAIRWTIVVFLLALGSYHLTFGLAAKTSGGVTSGALCLILGLILAMHPGVMQVIPILLGIWFIVSAVGTSRLAFSIPSARASASATISAIVSFICGIILIINPGGGAVGLTALAGILIFISAVASIVDLIILACNLKEISREFKSFFSVSRPGVSGKKGRSSREDSDSVQEAEVVSKKPKKK